MIARHATFDSRYCRGYTQAMKTAISIPAPLFYAAEQFAHEQGLSSSGLYVPAVQQYLQTHRYHGITDALNQVYAEGASGLDSALAAAQARVLRPDKR